MNLFGESNEIIRTLGFYQPFGTLMLHDKIETRWVRQGKKAPFPKGKYLFYSTLKRCDSFTLKEWSGDLTTHIGCLTFNDPTEKLNGYAIGIGNLVEVRPLTEKDTMSFIKFVGSKMEKGVTKVQWALAFENVQRITPFEFKFGKQGVGILPESEKSKILFG